MEVDSYQDGSITVKLSYKNKFFITIDDGSQTVKILDESKLIEALKSSKKGTYQSYSDDILETQSTERGIIIRKITISSKYQRRSVLVPYDKIEALVSYLEELSIIKGLISVQ